MISLPGARGYRGGYAWGYRIPQLYPPAHVQIPTQIQSASRSLCDQNQPRLAHTIMAFSQMDRRFIGGTAEMEQSWLRICVAVHRKGRKDRHELCGFVAGCHGKQRGVSKRNRFEMPVKILTFRRSRLLKISERCRDSAFLMSVSFADQIQKSFLCAPPCTASQTCTGVHIRAFYDNPLVL